MTSNNGGPSFNDGSLPDWLERASDLLAEPDPGPTKWLVQDVAVDQALIATVGRWKTTKTYWNLDVAISVATGQPHLGRLEIPQPGGVILVLEESGRAALWRRLDALARGRNIDRDALQDILVAPNKRVRLDDPKWQNDLVEIGRDLQPRLYLFDPLARMKSPGRDESAQKEFASVIEFMRDLRDETNAAVNWTHHTGHSGEQQRGTSDLESVWESRQGFKRDGSTITVTLDHREADSGLELSYVLDWDETSRSIRLDEIQPPAEAALRPIRDEVLEYVRDHPGASNNEVVASVGRNAATTRKIITGLLGASEIVRSTTRRVRSDGRAYTISGLYLAQPSQTVVLPGVQTHLDAPRQTLSGQPTYDNDIPF